ncbi:hypothetical protein [Coleofasciculus sp. FACHB-501]|uniref:hypothetical protein n=1 Tax=Cyanophyceae TaxID=3028117 RepID=UPI001682452E|nr:hypothetical protein [Coleofasciculus sp. FACHB-501]MBD1837225.1 hypothetical protein [Coleofasciculus sp. FACHB-501]
MKLSNYLLFPGHRPGCEMAFEMKKPPSLSTLGLRPLWLDRSRVRERSRVTVTFSSWIELQRVD